VLEDSSKRYMRCMHPCRIMCFLRVVCGACQHPTGSLYRVRCCEYSCIFLVCVRCETVALCSVLPRVGAAQRSVCCPRPHNRTSRVGEPVFCSFSVTFGFAVLPGVDFHTRVRCSSVSYLANTNTTTPVCPPHIPQSENGVLTCAHADYTGDQA
jgi:hypothetical protein